MPGDQTPTTGRVRYIILRLDDAKALAQGQAAPGVLARIREETGGDMEEIASLLMGLRFCHACVVECQQQYCESLSANQLGRRLRRLIERANAHRDVVNNDAE